jgi:hypothetical protein
VTWLFITIGAMVGGAMCIAGGVWIGYLQGFGDGGQHARTQQSERVIAETEAARQQHPAAVGGFPARQFSSWEELDNWAALERTRYFGGDFMLSDEGPRQEPQGTNPALYLVRQHDDTAPGIPAMIP